MWKSDAYLKITLTAIAVFLGILALRPLLSPAAARADSTATFAPLQFSESINEFESKNGHMVGRLAIDLRTGNILRFSDSWQCLSAQSSQSGHRDFRTGVAWKVRY